MIATYKTITDIQNAIATWQSEELSIGLVPTMGNLHDGHLALVKAALAAHDKVVVSIYVNPTQFAAHEDLANYPRTMADDIAALSALTGEICVFAPDSLYHDQHATMIAPQGAALPLEGVHRPHFFTGVATVVYRLFQAAPAHKAYFGEKDFQQIAVIRQMVRDFSLPIDIISVPTVRDQDGLALSSRNSYLSPDERNLARQLYAEMQNCASQIAAGQSVADALARSHKALLHAGFEAIDYFTICDPVSLARQDVAVSSSRLLAAIWCGKTRLIDNESFEKLCAAQ